MASRLILVDLITVGYKKGTVGLGDVFERTTMQVKCERWSDNLALRQKVAQMWFRAWDYLHFSSSAKKYDYLLVEAVPRGCELCPPQYDCSAWGGALPGTCDCGPDWQMWIVG
jgi:hypothetical protein